MHVLAGALFDSAAFKNCIVTGIVLAEDGKKMSKKLQNYPDPTFMLDKYGADAVRLYMLTSPVVQADNLAFSEKGVDELVKKNIGRLHNVLAFYQQYAGPSNGLGAGETLRDFKSENVLDRWILSRLEELVEESTLGYENYQLDKATRPISGFIDDLSVWYLRRSRDRFKTEGPDKTAALATMRYVLHRLLRIGPIDAVLRGIFVPGRAGGRSQRVCILPSGRAPRKKPVFTGPGREHGKSARYRDACLETARQCGYKRSANRSLS